METDRSFVAIPTIFDYHCPGQSNPTTLVWILGQVNKHGQVCGEKKKTMVRCAVSTDKSCIAEVVEKEKTRVRVAFSKATGVVSNTKGLFGPTLPNDEYVLVNEYPVKYSFLYGPSTYEILQTFFTG